MTIIQQNAGWTQSLYGHLYDTQVCADNQAKVITADIVLKELIV